MSLEWSSWTLIYHFQTQKAHDLISKLNTKIEALTLNLYAVDVDSESNAKFAHQGAPPIC